MTATPPKDVFDVVCPHCHKEFTAALLRGRSAGQSGFKCPHCKLFVAYERSSDQPGHN